MAQGDEEATTTVAVSPQGKVNAEPKKKWQDKDEKQQQKNNNATAGNGGKTFRELMIERVGSEEHSAISQVLSSQQEQFQTQVKELHNISQRQWQHVSKTLFPYLESFRPASLSSGQSATGASPLFSHEQQKAAVAAMNQAASVMNAQSASGSAKNWWHDPMKVMGIQHMPAFVHSGSMQASGSNQMESTMIGSHHPSAMYSAGQGHHQSQQGQQSQQRGGGSEQMPLASSSGRYADASASHAQGKRGHGSLSQEPNQQAPGANKSQKRQKSDHHQHHSGPQGGQQQHSLAGKGISNRDQVGGGGGLNHHHHPQQQQLQMQQQIPVKGPVSCPQPKVATPQSAIDILLALSEATSPTENNNNTNSNQASNRGSLEGAKKTAPQAKTTRLAGEAERLSSKNGDKKARKT